MCPLSVLFEVMEKADRRGRDSTVALYKDLMRLVEFLDTERNATGRSAEKTAQTAAVLSAEEERVSAELKRLVGERGRNDQAPQPAGLACN